MPIEVKVPALPESVADAVVVSWHKKVGDSVKRDESLVDVETDKVVLEVPAPVDGVIKEIIEQEGATVTAEQVLASMEAGDVSIEAESEIKTETDVKENKQQAVITPSARKMILEHQLDAVSIKGSGKGGRVLKEDVQKFLQQQDQPVVENKSQQEELSKLEQPVLQGERIEKRVPMTRLRARIAERLVEAQQNAAILTTFNEVNMQPVMELRKKYQEKFEKEYGVRLGFMSFFIKASIEALKQFPAVNASIDGDDIVYHGYFDIGVAVSSPRGLVVPVLRDADKMSLAEIEKSINSYAEKAKNNSIRNGLTSPRFSVSVSRWTTSRPITRTSQRIYGRVMQR